MKNNFNIRDAADVAEQERLNEMALNMQDARMFAMPTFPEAEMRSDHENEDVAAESNPEPKSLADQVAKTEKGRSMQCAAEERIEDVDADNADNYYEFEPTRNEIAILLEDGHLTVSEDGRLQLGNSLSTNELSAAREALLDLKLPTDRHSRQMVQEQVNQVVEQIQEKIAPKTAKLTQQTNQQAEVSKKEQIEQAKDTLMGSLRQLWSVQHDIKRAIREKRYYKLNELNEEAMLASLGILNSLEILRANDPDSLIDIVDEHDSLENPHNPVGDIVVQFARTHNSFRFSAEAEKELATLRLHEYRNGQTSDKPSFVASLQAAYTAPKTEDDPLEFMRQTTRIPKKRFDHIMEHILKN